MELLYILLPLHCTYCQISLVLIDGSQYNWNTVYFFLVSCGNTALCLTKVNSHSCIWLL